MDVGVLVGRGSVGVNVWVGGASVAVGVSVEITIDSVAVEVEGTSTGAVEGSVQAVSRKIKLRKVVKWFFISFTFLDDSLRLIRFVCPDFHSKPAQ